MVKKEYHTKLAGVTKKNDCDERIQSLLKDISDYCYEGMPLTVEHESDNPYDKNAIKVFCEGDHIGYIKRELAEELAPLVDKERVEVELCEITGGEDGKSFGCNILVRILSEKVTDNIEGNTSFRPLSDEDLSSLISQISEQLNESSHTLDKNTLDKIEKQLLIVSAETGRREAELRTKISNMTDSVDIEIEVLDAEHLRSMPDKEFLKLANEFIEWGQSLPRTANAQTFAYVQAQLPIINAELKRRTHNFKNGKFSSRPEKSNFTTKETLFDRIVPADSIREKALLVIAPILSFIITMSVLILLFA